MYDRALVIGGILVACLIVLAGVLLVTPGPESQARLGILAAATAPAIGALVAALRASQAKEQTNGKLDLRIEAAVHRAQAARRRGDEPATPAEIDAMDAAPPSWEG